MKTVIEEANFKHKYLEDLAINKKLFFSKKLIHIIVPKKRPTIERFYYISILFIQNVNNV